MIQGNLTSILFKDNWKDSLLLKNGSNDNKACNLLSCSGDTNWIPKQCPLIYVAHKPMAGFALEISRHSIMSCISNNHTLGNRLTMASITASNREALQQISTLFTLLRQHCAAKNLILVEDFPHKGCIICRPCVVQTLLQILD